MGNTLNNVIILFLIEINAFFEQKIRKDFPKLLIEDIIPHNELAPPRYLNDAELQEIEIRRGPRAVAQRIQKQMMLEWFPHYRCGMIKTKLIDQCIAFIIIHIHNCL